MATSDSDTDFESADEEMVGRGGSLKKDIKITYWTPSTVDSESDDDTEYVQQTPHNSSNWWKRSEVFRKTTISNVVTGQETSVGDKDDKIDSVKVEDDVRIAESVETFNNQENASKSRKLPLSTSEISVKDKNIEFMTENNTVVKSDDAMRKVEATEAGKTSEITQQRNLPHRLGTKKLAIRIIKDSDNKSTENQCLSECLNERSESMSKDTECGLQKDKNQPADDQSEPTSINDLSEMDIPEELKSNKKFKEVFQLEGWEDLENDIELPDELTEEKLEPVLEKLSLANKEPESSLENWNTWGNWGITSLLNTATTSVSTLTTHVSQGLTLLEGSIGLQDPRELTEIKQDETATLDGTISSINII